jgi:hypothetical protein
MLGNKNIYKTEIVWIYWIAIYRKFQDMTFKSPGLLRSLGLYINSTDVSKPQPSFEMSKTIYPATQRNIQEDSSVQPQCCVKLKSSPRVINPLTLNPLMWKIWWAPNNAGRWQMGFNSVFKGLKTKRLLSYLKTQSVPRSKHFSSRL